MDHIMSLVMLLACAASQCEPLQDALQRRSDVFGVYASEYTREYEPVAFAAVPLHAPLPIIHIMSTAPLPMPRYAPSTRPQRPRSPSSSYNPKPAYSHHASSFIQPPTAFGPAYSHQASTFYRQPTAYAEQMEPYPQLQAIYRQQPTVYAPSITYTTNADPPEMEDDAPTILYARPQPQGGYTYHRRPTKKRVPPKRKEPVIIRVHKYRVLKGR